MRWILAALILTGCPKQDASTVEVEAGRYWAHASTPTAADHFEYRVSGSPTWDTSTTGWLYGLEPATAYEIRACRATCEVAAPFETAAAPALPPITLADNELQRLGTRWVPWGNNYVKVTGGGYTQTQPEDRMYDADGLALIDADFARLAVGENAIRMHLQLHTFLVDATTPDAEALARYAHVIELAEDRGLYVMVTGLNEFFPPENPPWLATQDEAAHWATQALWWSAMAKALHASPGVFAFDLVNEPNIGGNHIVDGVVQWTGTAPTEYCTYGANADLGIPGTCFDQFITPDLAGRDPAVVAADWTARMTDAVGGTHLVTIGVGGSFGLYNPFNSAPGVHASLDFLSPHLYPNDTNSDPIQLAADLRALTPKPIVAGETFTFGNVRHLIATTCNAGTVDGWFGQYDGRNLGDACNNPNAGACLLYDAWYQVQLDFGPTMTGGNCPPPQ